MTKNEHKIVEKVRADAVYKVQVARFAKKFSSLTHGVKEKMVADDTDDNVVMWMMFFSEKEMVEVVEVGKRDDRCAGH